MRIEKEHAGKWVAIKDNKIIASDISFEELSDKTDSRRDKGDLYFTLIPKGLVAG